VNTSKSVRHRLAGMIEMDKGFYQEKMQIFDGLPFIQAFLASVEQYGAGQLKAGVYNRLITALYGSDLRQL
jgi:hypothetical protein